MDATLQLIQHYSICLPFYIYNYNSEHHSGFSGGFFTLSKQINNSILRKHFHQFDNTGTTKTHKPPRKMLKVAQMKFVIDVSLGH